ncbi:MAG: type II toxin-antitoxin system VapC family toxin [Verrucomicrobia bacterium]|nr:type II toxin-antitoxin system VapC family toxin [Verrucomicrobiota bacterium]MCH8527713.1 type II toxin-antitoxin system VapC family toxin [Kiritimatiellia bacterium]
MKEVLLDTCVFLWLALQPEKIPPKAASHLNDTRNPRLLSQVSVLEMVLKYRAGKLPLPMPPEAWIPSRLAFFCVNEIPLPDAVIYQSRHLPSEHADPFDRLIAAQALARGSILLSSDRKLRDLGADVVWED